MQGLSDEALLLTLVAVAVILLIGRGAAEVARRLGQPEVLGELIGGVILGPSALGAIFPGLYRAVFLNHTVGQGLSLLSWLGAILLLMIAGLEVDLRILRQNARPGSLAAVGAIIPSILAGFLFARLFLGVRPPGGVFLGLVLSVTAVSVAAKILIERDALRRSYAQVILAAGVASEVAVWLLISVVVAFKAGEGMQGIGRSVIIVVLFFALMMTLGRRFTFWAMRRMADVSIITNGELSLVLVLMFVAAAITEALGFHALLGAFVFGVLLSQAPRATEELRSRVQTLTISLFAPIFFVMAGMRVNIFQLGSPAALGEIFLLLLAATGIKVGLGALGALWGGLRRWESLLVGVGLNLKGGTDVIVAIVGVQLGLLSVRIYTIYTVVAILTVLAAPAVIAYLERRVPPGQEELARLNREEARRRSYMPRLERILVPVAPGLHAEDAAALVERIIQTKRAEKEIFDVTQLVVGKDAAGDAVHEHAIAHVENRLSDATDQGETAELTRRDVQSHDALDAILNAAEDHDLIAIGASPPDPAHPFTLGSLQDKIISHAEADVLVTIHGRQSSPRAGRILVAVNGFAHSLAAGDVAAYLAKANDAELVLFTSVRARTDTFFWRNRSHRHLLQSGYHLLRELDFRVSRLGVRTSQQVELNDDPGAAIVKELAYQPYDLVVLGAVDRSTDAALYLGTPIETVLMRGRTPAVVLVTHDS